MRVVAITHGPDVGPELLGEVIREEGHELVEWDIRARGAPDAFDAALVLGGAQNVGEEVDHPWLHEEYDLLRRAIDAGTPVLGVCLGAETLAHAAGGRVAKAATTFAGFYATELTAAGRDDPVLGVLPPSFEALNANGYTFDVPPGGVELARTGTYSQAFRAGARAWGVQFHPEVRRDQILSWYEQDGILTDELRAEIDAGIGRWQELGRRLARAFVTVSDTFKGV